MDIHVLLRSQFWPRIDLQRLSIRRFRDIAQYAAKMPFWADRYNQVGIDPYCMCAEDIPRIPLLTKRDFFNTYLAAYTNKKLLEKSNMYHTSGSTGVPLHFYHDQQFELRSSAISERMFWAAGNGRRFPVVLMRGVPHMGFEFAKHHFFYLRGYTGVRHRIYELQKFATSFSDGFILFGLGSSLLELARICRELGVALPLRCILTSGEELHQSQRLEVEEKLGTEVRISYGMSEIRRLGFECECHRIHINEDTTYFEITNSNGAPLPSGVAGRIIVTGFENHVMPFIRYDTGDIGIINEEACPCGRTLRTMEFQGRKAAFLNVGDSRTVSLLDISHLFDRYYENIRQFQIVRNGQCSFVMRIVPGINVEKAQTELIDHFRLRIHPRVQIEWEITDAIPEAPNGKALYFVSSYKEADTGS